MTNLKQRIVLVVFALLAFSSAIGQIFEKVVFNAKEAEDYYIQLKPAAEKIQGVLVLMPGYGEKAESIFPSSNLFNTAYANCILFLGVILQQII